MVQNGTEFEKSGLSSRRQQALPIIAAVPTLAQAARSSGIGQGVPYRWLQDNRFRHELTRLRPNTADLARYELRGLMLRCLDMSTNYPTLTIPASEPESIPCVQPPKSPSPQPVTDTRPLTHPPQAGKLKPHDANPNSQPPVVRRRPPPTANRGRSRPLRGEALAPSERRMAQNVSEIRKLLNREPSRHQIQKWDEMGHNGTGLTFSGLLPAKPPSCYNPPKSRAQGAK